MTNPRKVVLISGAATGIGRGCAESLAQAGFSVAVNYRSRAKEAQELLSQLAGSGHKTFLADVADPQQAHELVKRTVEEMGRIDVLINAAGRFEEQDVTSTVYSGWQEQWQKALRTNLMAPANLSFCASDYMIRQGSGKIINITSRGAFRGEPTAPAYGASKAGLNSMSQSLAVALAPHGITVYAIAPGWTETPAAMSRISERLEAIESDIPLGRIGRPEEIGRLAAFLAGNDTEYLTGAIIDVNGASYLRN